MEAPKSCEIILAFDSISLHSLALLKHFQSLVINTL